MKTRVYALLGLAHMCDWISQPFKIIPSYHTKESVSAGKRIDLICYNTLIAILHLYAQLCYKRRITPKRDKQAVHLHL